MQDQQQPVPDFGEPWKSTNFKDGGIITRCDQPIMEGLKLVKRAVACVNSCAGMVDPAAEIQALRDTLKAATDYKSAAQLCVEHPNLAEYIVQLERELLTAKLLIAANKTVWQPIETAPTNESVLVYFPNREHYGPGIYRAILVDMGTGRRWMTTGLDCGRDCVFDQPTHWMPMPSLPNKEAHQPSLSEV